MNIKEKLAGCRLINGECLQEMDKLIEQGIKVDAIITDPPYGITACKWDSIIPLDEMWLRLNKQHPTQKPVALMEYLIKTYTNEGETVLDFTMGSGTTGVACTNLNGNFIGIELNPEFFKIAEKRINENL